MNKIFHLFISAITKFFGLQICAGLHNDFPVQNLRHSGKLQRKIFIKTAQIFKLLKFYEEYYRKNLRNFQVIKFYEEYYRKNLQNFQVIKFYAEYYRKNLQNFQVIKVLRRIL